MSLQSIIERKHSDIVYKLFREKVMRVRGADFGVPIPSGEGAMLLPSHQSVHFDTWTVETAAHLLLFLVPCLLQLRQPYVAAAGGYRSDLEYIWIGTHGSPNYTVDVVLQEARHEPEKYATDADLADVDAAVSRGLGWPDPEYFASAAELRARSFASYTCAKLELGTLQYQ